MKRMLLVALPLLLAGSGMTCLTGCMLDEEWENNQTRTWTWGTSFSYETTVAKIPETIAKRHTELTIDPRLMDGLFPIAGPPEPDGEEADDD